jgi:peptidoglycan/xylan/chitin deacetylase (PgdA/CDA1 family)
MSIALLRRAAAVAALVVCSAVEARAQIPVLAWHGFSDAPAPGEGNLTSSYADFEEFLRFLRANGFRSVFPGDAAPGAGRPIILTFDDGTAGWVRAAELLERHGFRGLFFVIPTRTGSPHFLSAEEVERLARAGHRVAPHGYAHRSLATSGSEVAASIYRSPAMLDEQTGGAPDTADFAFPFGHYTAEVAEAIGRNYAYLHTVNPGYWDGRSPMLPRMLLMSDVDPALYRDYVLGAAGQRPTLHPVTPDGAVAERVEFRGRVPAGAELLAITADAAGRSYVSRPLDGEFLRVSGDTAWLELAGYLARHHPPGRIVVSYALVTRERGRIRYLTPGLLHWSRDPVAAGRPGPPPPEPQWYGP